MDRETFKQKFTNAEPVLTSLFESEVRKSTERLGETTKLVIAMEEASELQQAIAKMYRGKGNRMQLIEEIGDVLICIECLKQIFDISDEDINRAINVKIDRGVS